MSANRQDLEAMLEAAFQAVPDPTQSLPDPVFQFILKITPMINVDLLVRNEKGEHLLAWRKDEYGEGWHVPGGIIRYKEPIERRIAAVAKGELAAEVAYSPLPVDLRQLWHTRGHFISLLYLCKLSKPVGNPSLWYAEGAPRHGQLRWWRGVPADVYWVHNTYAEWLNGRTA
jgi:colanic acid biosynthesis protein WcaH